MDSQNNSNSTNPPLFADPFSTTSFPLPTSTNTPVVTNNLNNSNPQNPFSLPSPSPSTPARLPFNPDDFLVSPPQPSQTAAESQRATPELKRRLFCPPEGSSQRRVTDVNASASRDVQHYSTNSQPSMGMLSPPDQAASPIISFSFSPQNSFLPDVLQANGASTRANSLPIVSSSLDHSLMDVLPSPSPQRHPNSKKSKSLLFAQSNMDATPHSLPFPSPVKHSIPFSGKDETRTPTNIPVTSHEDIKSQHDPNAQRDELERVSKSFPDSAFKGSVVLSANGRPLSHLPTTPFTPDPSAAKFKCSCKASRCLKLYCLCFAHSGYCSDGCSCKNCHNTMKTPQAVREARDAVLTRDPRAFDPKVRLSVQTLTGTSSASDIHAKGCNCRKGCSKKYCVCRELRVECGPRCTCSGPKGCLNRKKETFSHKEALSSLNSLTPAASSASTIQGTPLKTSMFSSGEGQGTSGPPDIELPPSGYTSIIADQLKGQRGKNKGKIKVRVRKRDRENLGKELNGPRNSKENAADLTSKRPKRDISNVEESNDGSVNNDSIFGSNFIGAADGPVHGFELVGLDIDKSPVVGLNDDVEKFREVTNGIDENTEERSNDVGIQMVEHVLSKISGNDAAGGFDKNILKKGGKTFEGSNAGNASGGSLTLNNGPSQPKSKEADGNQENSFRMFGRESDGIEVCRLPRILRVKMGSGRLLSKFSF